MKRPFLRFAVSYLIAFLGFFPKAQAATFEDAVGKYRGSQFKEALADFSALLDQDPDNVALLINASLAAFKASEMGLSVGFLKKALRLEPQNQTARNALSYVQSQMSPKDLPRELSNWELLRGQILVHLTVPQWISFSMLCLLGALWALLSFLGRRRQAIKGGAPPPGFKLIEFALVSLGVIGFSLAGAKLIDARQVRGVLLPAKVTVYSAPNSSSVSLLNLHSGFEVVFLRQQDSWVQIQYPGSVTGWVEAKDVFWIDSPKAQN
jgi:tetratricopeptide (TPR) repeat protein